MAAACKHRWAMNIAQGRTVHFRIVYALFRESGVARMGIAPPPSPHPWANGRPEHPVSPGGGGEGTPAQSRLEERLHVLVPEPSGCHRR